MDGDLSRAGGALYENRDRSVNGYGVWPYSTNRTAHSILTFWICSLTLSEENIAFMWWESPFKCQKSEVLEYVDYKKNIFIAFQSAYVHPITVNLPVNHTVTLIHTHSAFSFHYSSFIIYHFILCSPCKAACHIEKTESSCEP